MWLLLAVVIGAGFGGKASTVSSPQLQQMMSSAERIFAESGRQLSLIVAVRLVTVLGVVLGRNAYLEG